LNLNALTPTLGSGFAHLPYRGKAVSCIGKIKSNQQKDRATTTQAVSAKDITQNKRLIAPKI
jgi:hypothetical protein